MKNALFLIAIAMMPFVFNGCKNKENVENPLVGNWVIIGEQAGYATRFEGVEFYLNFQDNGKMVQYLYSGKYAESVWDNGVLSGESWTEATTYTWKSSGNVISFSPKFWGMNQVEYKKVNNDVIEIESMAFGRVKKIVTTK